MSQVGVLCLQVRFLKSWSKQHQCHIRLIKYSFVILISVMVVANFHRYELSDGAWPLMVDISAKLSCSKFVWESQICPKCEALWQVISVFEQRVKRISVKSWFEPLRPVMTAIELCEEKFLRIIHTHNADSGRLLCCPEQKFLVYPSLQAVKWQPAADTEHQINIKGTWK